MTTTTTVLMLIVDLETQHHCHHRHHRHQVKGKVMILTMTMMTKESMTMTSQTQTAWVMGLKLLIGLILIHLHLVEFPVSMLLMMSQRQNHHLLCLSQRTQEQGTDAAVLSFLRCLCLFLRRRRLFFFSRFSSSCSTMRTTALMRPCWPRASAVSGTAIASSVSGLRLLRFRPPDHRDFRLRTFGGAGGTGGCGGSGGGPPCGWGRRRAGAMPSAERTPRQRSAPSAKARRASGGRGRRRTRP